MEKNERETGIETECEFLEKLECLAALGITGSVKDETPFFILQDIVKLRRMELATAGVQS